MLFYKGEQRGETIFVAAAGEFGAKMVTNTNTACVGLVQPQYGGLSERGKFSANKIGVEGNLTYSSIRIFTSRGNFMYWGRNSKM